jgi:hypothetical protein
MDEQERVYKSLIPVANALEALGVPYHIGGSAASSAYGFGRSTIDIDIVADLQHRHVEPLCKMLEEEYYIDGEMLHEAINRRSSFNLLHLGLFGKVDVFIPKEHEFDRLAFTRVRQARMYGAKDNRLFNHASPEDTILRKLDWFRLGGGTSERQWLDTIGVLKVQANSLDYDYLWEWARKLNLAELLQKALEDAGL